MSSRSKTENPEEMLLRLIRVAHILAHGDVKETGNLDEHQQEQPTETLQHQSYVRKNTDAKF